MELAAHCVFVLINRCFIITAAVILPYTNESQDIIMSNFYLVML